MTISLAFLAPELVKAAVEGRLPSDDPAPRPGERQASRRRRWLTGRSSCFLPVLIMAVNKPGHFRKLRETYVAAVADPVVRQKLIDAGAELLQSSPQEMGDHMRKEAAKWAEVIHTANIQLD